MTELPEHYESFFERATGGSAYPFQKELAICQNLPQVLSIPTGVGKTAAIILGWLYRRRFAGESTRNRTPRRLVYCLPMRTLVEQTQNATAGWLKNLSLENDISLHLLMGGEEATDWDESPQRDAILIGTQDMLLSRALNRGYGMSRYRWPIHFALLNNDALWVMDETQLMGVGLTTSAQLQGLRYQLSTYGNCQTLWMSATMNLQSLRTVDHHGAIQEQDIQTLSQKDEEEPAIQKLIKAIKPLQRFPLELNWEGRKTYASELAKEVVKKHQQGTITLVVLNRVSRTQDVYKAVQKLLEKQEEVPDLFLIHSRFRPADRAEIQQQALDEATIDSSSPGRIVIATQAIEAGVDFSATTLITELAPFSSMVQRFGRCNRRGTCGTEQSPCAAVYWIDIETEKKDLCLPYTEEELAQSRKCLLPIEDVGISSLSKVQSEAAIPIVHVLRRKDLLDLFDTTPDLAGNDLDVSRYIRDSQDTDSQVYWRNDWDESSPEGPPNDEDVFPPPTREELCCVSVAMLKGKNGFVAKSRNQKHHCYTWNPLDSCWDVIEASNIRPGMTLLFHADAGGYDQQIGWTGEPKHKPDVIPIESHNNWEAMDRDDFGSKPLSLPDHLRDVAGAAENLKEKLKTEEDDIPWDAIIQSAWWHDVGKGHEAFQNAMRDFEMIQQLDPDRQTLWAKSGGKGIPQYRIVKGEKTISRRGFRHELASALAWLSQHEGKERANLIAYLIAAHHGKVRMSIRSMPNENSPQDSNIKFARGIWEGDVLPAMEIGNDELLPETTLDLDLMQLGESDSGPSWLSRTLELRTQYGPFKLAYLEALVRIADWHGSRQEGEDQ